MKLLDQTICVFNVLIDIVKIIQQLMALLLNLEMAVDFNLGSVGGL